MRQFNPPHPGEILKMDYLEPLKLTITDAANGLGIARKNLSAIINGKAEISPSRILIGSALVEIKNDRSNAKQE